MSTRVILETDRWRLIPQADGAAEAEPKCPYCGGSGIVDSGGQTPWGQWIELPCPECCSKPVPEPAAKTLNKNFWSLT